LLAIPETLLRSTHCRSILSIELEKTPQKDGETPDQETGRVVSFRRHFVPVIDYYRDRGGIPGWAPPLPRRSSRRRPPARPVPQIPDIVEAGLRKNELPVGDDVTVIPGIEYHAVDRCGDIVGIEEHLAVVVVLDDRTEPVPDLAVRLRSCMKRQHLPVLEGGAPPPAELLIPLFHRKERHVGRCRLLAAEFGNMPEKRDGLPPPALGLGEEGLRRPVPF